MWFEAATHPLTGASVLHSPSDLNPSRSKRGLRRLTESSDLRREGSWRGQWQQSARGSPARLPDQGVMPGGTRPSPTGLFATSRHGNFTGSRQTARVLVIQLIRTPRFFELIDKVERCLQPHRHRQQRSHKLAHHGKGQPVALLAALRAIQTRASRSPTTRAHFCNEARAALLHQHS